MRSFVCVVCRRTLPIPSEITRPNAVSVCTRCVKAGAK